METVLLVSVPSSGRETEKRTKTETEAFQVNGKLALPPCQASGKAGTASVTLLRLRAPTGICLLHDYPWEHDDGDEVEGRSAGICM